MPSQATRDAAAVAAGWSPHPNLTAASKALTEKYPDLHLRVWALPDGVHILAYIQRYEPGGKLHVTDVARAVFMPREVTEVGVVDWARRALAHWLQGQLEAEGS